ncbi:hypothetical protein YTPLAS18_22000 [Nitrospira sp.]|nr:hypothetical protein YTPLAS18_22000 [Nitrospira sp.]
MPIPDGISTEDWDRVHELSLGIVNAPGEAEATIVTKQLLAYLDELELAMARWRAYLPPVATMFQTRVKR